jgi:hypothetical protein
MVHPGSSDDPDRSIAVTRTLTTKLALAGGVAALALGAAACENDDMDPAEPADEQPVTEDEEVEPVPDDAFEEDPGLEDEELDETDTIEDDTLEDETTDG